MANGIRKDNNSSLLFTSLDELCKMLHYDILINIVCDKMGVVPDKVIAANSWDELGFDEIDGIELIRYMIQIDMCYTCPQCGNGSLDSDDVYKYFGFKYIHTEYKCLMQECDFSTTGSKNMYFVYDETILKTKKREARLNSLFDYI